MFACLHQIYTDNYQTLYKSRCLTFFFLVWPLWTSRKYGQNDKICNDTAFRFIYWYHLTATTCKLLSKCPFLSIERRTLQAFYEFIENFFSAFRAGFVVRTSRDYKFRNKVEIAFNIALCIGYTAEAKHAYVVKDGVLLAFSFFRCNSPTENLSPATKPASVV